MKEQEIGTVMVAWLERAGWDVYQEVQPGRWDGRADIVAIKNTVALIVECKTSLGLSVIEQAIRWIGSAPLIAVAVPDARSIQAQRSWLAEKILRGRGIGLFRVGDGFDGEPYIRDEPDMLPKWNCSLDPRWQHKSPWLDTVSEGHKTHAQAGSPGGGHLTPFKVTMGLMANFVAAHPGCTRQDIAEGIAHHYSSDQSFATAMSVIMMRGWCPGVDEKTEGRRCHYYPTSTEQGGSSDGRQ